MRGDLDRRRNPSGVKAPHSKTPSHGVLFMPPLDMKRNRPEAPTSALSTASRFRVVKEHLAAERGRSPSTFRIDFTRPLSPGAYAILRRSVKNQRRVGRSEVANLANCGDAWLRYTSSIPIAASPAAAARFLKLPRASTERISPTQIADVQIGQVQKVSRCCPCREPQSFPTDRC